MSNERPNIPGLRIKRIGSRTQSTKLIQGIIQLPCWDGYYRQEETYYKKKEKVITGGQITLRVDGVITPNEKIKCDPEQVNTYYI